MVVGNGREFIIVENGVNRGSVDMKGFKYSPNGVSEDTGIWVLALLLIEGGLRPGISGHTG